MQTKLFEFFLSKGYKWTISLGSGLFLFVFLLAFLPFGVSNYNPNHDYDVEFLSEISKFMLLTTLLSVGCEFHVKPWVVRNPTTSSVVGWFIFMFVVLGLGNYLLYNWLGNWHDLGLKSGLQFILNCSTIFVFPFLGVFFYFRYRILKERIQLLVQPGNATLDTPELIHFSGEGKSAHFTVASSGFRYAQAQDNYVALYYIKDSELKKELIRGSLADMLTGVDCAHLIRCHRSFAINIRQVRSATGGSPVLLFLNDVPEPIRVSRTYRNRVLHSMNALT